MVDEILDHAGRLDGAQALPVEHDGHLGREGSVSTAPRSLTHSGASPATATGRLCPAAGGLGMGQGTMEILHHQAGRVGLSWLPCRTPLFTL